jgi:hypothetical protein
MGIAATVAQHIEYRFGDFTPIATPQFGVRAQELPQNEVGRTGKPQDARQGTDDRRLRRAIGCLAASTWPPVRGPTRLATGPLGAATGIAAGSIRSAAGTFHPLHA